MAENLTMPGRRWTVEVSHAADVGEARRAARQAGEQLGFDAQACEEIVLATSELATNLLKHAGGGRIVLTPLAQQDRRTGLQLESLDRGPGLANVGQALADGFSTAGSLGIGLGAVNRLMDEFDVASSSPRGTHIVCRKWMRAPATRSGLCPLAVGVATRPHPHYDVNGDAYIVEKWAASALVGIVDGLGHGERACEAAHAARQYVATHFDLRLDQIFRGVDLVCRGTRGVVMALARFDWGAGRLSFASVSNIEARVWGGGDRFQFEVRRGILGYNAPNALVTQHHWSAENVMVIHSDGVRSHWTWDQFPNLVATPAEALAREFLQSLGKEDDDATVLVVKARSA